jgi:hypothetical protein
MSRRISNDLFLLLREQFLHAECYQLLPGRADGGRKRAGKAGDRSMRDMKGIR